MLATGMVCTPAEQTDDIKRLGALTRSELESLLQYNVTMAEGRMQFVQKYNELNFADKLQWSQKNEDMVASEDEFIAFMKFKAQVDAVSSLMISMIEGNHRLLCIFFTYALRKVHKLSALTTEKAKEGEGLTVEYLRKKGVAINGDILVVEGSTDVRDGVRRVIHDDTTLMVNLNLSIPTSENCEKCPVGTLLNECRGESSQYALAKKASSSQTDFMHLAEVLNKAIPRRSDGSVKQTRLEVVRKLSGKFEIEGEKFNTSPSTTERKKWAARLVSSTKGDSACSLTITVDEISKTYPLRRECWKQIKAGKKERTDLNELNLFVVGRVILAYCMKTHGGSSDDAIDDMVRVFIEKSVYNFSGDWRCNKISKIGSDGNKGVAAGVCVMSLYVVGNVFKVQEDVLKLFDTLGRGELSQTHHWNGLRK